VIKKALRTFEQWTYINQVFLDYCLPDGICDDPIFDVSYSCLVYYSRCRADAHFRRDVIRQVLSKELQRRGISQSRKARQVNDSKEKRR